MKIITSLIILFFSSFIMHAESELLGKDITKIEINIKKTDTKKPRSVVKLAVECWFGDGNLLIISEGDYIQSVKLTDMATGEVTTETVSGNATSHTAFVGNTSVIIEITLSNGDVYEGALIQ